MVWVVKFKGDSQYYAMKEMQKLKIATRKSIKSTMNEQKLLKLLRHPFIVNMKFSFQDDSNLYLVMDLMQGGDLRYHLHHNKKFTEAQTRFFVACILTGLEYIHINSIIHRDIKPENLVLDSKGYIRITDFGIARKLSGEDNSHDTSGTPGYMAPEVHNKKSHDHCVDYFALGVVAYEFMTGKRPYLGRDRKEIKERVLSKQVRLTKSQVPDGWSMESVDFINKLLERNPAQRLGSGGPQELKNHIWLRDFNWKGLLEKKIVSPFKCEGIYNFDSRVFLNFKDENDYSIDLAEIQYLFEGYYFDWREAFGRTGETTLKARTGF